MTYDDLEVLVSVSAAMPSLTPDALREAADALQANLDEPEIYINRPEYGARLVRESTITSARTAAMDIVEYYSDKLGEPVPPEIQRELYIIQTALGALEADQ